MVTCRCCVLFEEILMKGIYVVNVVLVVLMGLNTYPGFSTIYFSGLPTMYLPFSNLVL